MRDVETGSRKLVILSYAIVCYHPCVSLNNEKNCLKISENKIASCDRENCKPREQNLSGLNSAC